MKAIVYTKYGSPDVLQLKEVEKPTPKENEVLVKVLATSVNAADWHLLTADIVLVRLNMGCSNPKTRSSAVTSRGGLKRLAEMLNSLSLVIWCSEMFSGTIMAVLLSM